MRERLQRHTVAGLMIRLAEVERPMRLAAALRRRRGGQGEIEIYFAFDDAESAYAVIALAELLEGRQVQLRARPVVNRGIPNDPAADRKREYALHDARRLFMRGDVEMKRTETLLPADTSFLAEWVAAAPESPRVTDFCRQAMQMIWVEGAAPDRDRLGEMWEQVVGGAPQTGGAGVGGNEKMMRRRRMYETPAAWVAGRWYFAHERVEQIGEWLDRLGWVVKA